MHISFCRIFLNEWGQNGCKHQCFAEEDPSNHTLQWANIGMVGSIGCKCTGQKQQQLGAPFVPDERSDPFGEVTCDRHIVFMSKFSMTLLIWTTLVVVATLHIYISLSLSLTLSPHLPWFLCHPTICTWLMFIISISLEVATVHDPSLFSPFTKKTMKHLHMSQQQFKTNASMREPAFHDCRWASTVFLIHSVLFCCCEWNLPQCYLSSTIWAIFFQYSIFLECVLS